jgi:hypothetical protein
MRIICSPFYKKKSNQEREDRALARNTSRKTDKEKTGKENN